METKMEISPEQRDELFKILNSRFEKNWKRHKNLVWSVLQAKLVTQPAKLGSLFQMEETGGEPDVVGQDAKTGEFIFFDCAPESPIGRRSLCYDRKALDSRKEFKPENTVMDLAAEMGVELMTEEEYRELLELGKFDSKTSSWLKTPESIRKLGGAIFAEFRYDHIFIFHNGASSYYAVRGFRGVLRV